MIARPALAALLLLLLLCANAAAQTPELVVQTGRPGGSSAFDFSPDGRLVATGGGLAVKLWDTATGRGLRDLKGLISGPDCVAFAPDGKTVMASSGSFTVMVWDVLTGRELRHFNFVHDGWSFGRAFSPDGRIFASGGDDMTVKLWDVSTGRLLHTMRVPGLKVYAVAFSPDGQTIVGGGNGAGQRLMRWSVATGTPLPSPAVPSGMVHTLAVSPDGRFIASDDGKTVKLWAAQTQRLLHTLGGGARSINTVAFSPDSRTLASQGPDTIVDFWDVATGKLLRELPGGRPFAFNHDGKLFAVGSGDNVKLLDAGTAQESVVFRAHAAYTDAVTFSPDGKMLASLTDGYPRTVKLWNVSAGRELSTLKADNNLAGPSLAFSPDSRLLATPSAFNTMRLWDTSTNQALLTWGKEYYLDFSHVSFFPDGRYVVTVGSTGKIVYWDATTGKPFGALKGDTQYNAMAFSPDARLLAIGGYNNIVTVWEVTTGQKRFELRGHTKAIQSVAFSPDSKTLASGGDDMTIKLWDASAGAELRTLRGHTDEIMSIAYSPDGKTLVSGDRQGTIKLWAAETGRELHTLNGLTGDIVRSVAYSADGKLVAAAGFDDGVRLWDAVTGQALASLIAVDEHDWLVVTPDGLFDGSPAAWSLVLWRFGQNSFDVLPAEAFFNEFFYPGLLTDLFAGRRPQAARALAQKDRHQPELKIATADAAAATNGARQVTVTVAVTKAAAGAQDVRLFRNGSLVKVWRGDVLKGQASVTLAAQISLVAGTNRLTAYAFNRDNIKSAEAGLTIAGADSLRRKGTAYIIAIGVNRYAANPFFRNLKFAVADAEAFATEIKQQQARLAQYEQVEVVTLLDEAATKSNILSALAKKVQPEDVVIVYFAGHGLAAGGQFYLIPHDLGASVQIAQADTQAVLAAALAAQGISDRELEQAFENLDAGQITMVVDACNSGQALGDEKEGRGPMNSKGLAQLAYDKGMYILTAAQSYQAALEAPQFGHGLLTFALVEEGLKQALADNEPADGRVLVREWLDYATTRVPQMQLDKMKAARGLGLGLSFNEDERGLDVARRSGQRPRVFYRRELEAQPLVIAKPARP